MEALEHRVLNFKKELLKKEKDEQVKTVHLLFTHGTLQQLLSKSYTGEEPKSWAAYCSVTGITINREGSKK